MARSTFFASDHADAPRGPARRLKIGHPRKMPAGLHFRPLAVFFPLSRLRRRGRSSATSRCSENFCGCLRTRSKAAFAGSFGCRRMATDRNRAKPGVVSGGLAVLLGVTALVLWTSRAYLAAQFASSYGLTVGLLIQNDSDRPRLERALASLTVPHDVNASYAFDRNSSRRSQIEVSAPTREKAVAAARTLGDVVAKAYDSAGDTRLDVRVPGRAYPEDNTTTTMVRTAITYGAPVLGLLAIGLFAMAWRQGRRAGVISLPAGAGLLVAAIAAFWIGVVVLPGWLFMAVFAMMIPTSIAGVIVYKMGEVRRASRWPSAPGRIVVCKTRKVHTKQSGGAPSIGNVPDITYVYTVDGVERRGKRIGIGEIKPDSPEVEAALERYQVGRTGPVFYNPAKPDEAVLERDPP